MMTPEDGAARIAGRMMILPCGADTIQALVEQVIRVAIDEERAACASLAEDGEWDHTAAECSGECGEDIARAIRARKQA